MASSLLSNANTEQLLDTLWQYCDVFATWCQDHEHLAAKTVFLVSPGEGIDAKFNDAADAVGMDAETVKYVLCLFLAYPLGFIQARLPGAAAKNLFSLIVGVWMLQLIYHSQWIHSFITITGSYLMMLALPKKIMPATIFFFALAYVVVSHLYRMYVDLYGWQVDFTGPQMVLTMKLSSFAWNLYDGSKYDQLTAPKEDKRLTAQMDQRKRFAIREMPSPLEYFAFQYNFSSILVGPAFEYNDYIRAVTGEAFAGKDGKPQSAPGNVLSALHRLLVGVACLVINQVGQPMFPIKGMISEEMLAKPFVLRAAYAWVSLLACRCKYYFAWKVAEGGAILAGFGYEGSDPKTGKPNWTGVSNMDIIGFETASNIAASSRAWNKRTQGWLERYVYTRTGSSLTATYATSAFWHGFYPGYYLFFLSLPMATASARVGKRKISPILEGGGALVSKAYQLLCIVGESLFVNYMVIPFQMLAFEPAWAAWSSFYFAGHVALAVIYILGMVLPASKKNGNGNGKKTK